MKRNAAVLVSAAIMIFWLCRNWLITTMGNMKVAIQDESRESMGT